MGAYQIGNFAPGGATYAVAAGGTQLRVLADKLGEFISVKDFGAKGDGATDDTAAFQAAIDRAYALAAPSGSYGRVITIDVPDGVYKIGSITLKSHVVLRGRHVHGMPHGHPGARLSAITGTTGYLIDTPDEMIYSCGVIGLGISGLGADHGGLLGGVQFRKVRRGVISHNCVNAFSDRGIYVKNDSILDNPSINSYATHIEDNFCFNCLMDLPASPKGVLEVHGTDHFIRGGEYAGPAAQSAARITGTSQAGGTTTTFVLAAGTITTDNQYVGWMIEIPSGQGFECAIITASVASTQTVTLHRTLATSYGAGLTYALYPVLRCALLIAADASEVTGGVYETADCGILVRTVTTPCRFTSVRADLNRGPGWVFDGAAMGVGLHAHNNGQAGSDTYDAFLVCNQIAHGSVVGAQVTMAGSIGHRYGFHLAAVSSAPLSAMRFSECYSRGHKTQMAKLCTYNSGYVGFTGPTVRFTALGTRFDTGTGSVNAAGLGVSGITAAEILLGSAGNLQYLQYGVDGQELKLVFFNTNCTIVHGTGTDAIKCPGATNVTPEITRLYTLRRHNGSWYLNA